ncbi:hypothetical protein F3087_44815 [Nocardia colli]|uniref:Esterase family protein n=1 Tax=Nocardia colli TaxID=2545717 RepID=A0A5N0DLG9_9NOCA|nr:alpha/beta hydrolase-fold protein [Nocardia colli]KAA8877300.1 hypothetical protein F3087_44815 [Nocardia colli]
MFSTLRCLNHSNAVKEASASGQSSLQFDSQCTRELPPLIDKYFTTSGRNAIAGFSMAGTTTLALAATSGDLYSSVAAYSGCAQISDPVGKEFVRLTVETWGWAHLENMYGAANDPRWAPNDPYVQAEALRSADRRVPRQPVIRPGQHAEFWRFSN